jgi:hypothetical protein
MGFAPLNFIVQWLINGPTNIFMDIDSSDTVNTYIPS